jgi:hypothetical protein
MGSGRHAGVSGAGPDDEGPALIRSRRGRRRHFDIVSRVTLAHGVLAAGPHPV